MFAVLGKPYATPRYATRLFEPLRRNCLYVGTLRKAPSSRRAASTTDQASLSEKPYYVTTPIFYVNAAPHVGHLYAMILADILKRWAALKGHEAILCTGTDEHGMKVQRAAAKAGIETKAYCDRASEIFRTLAERADVSNDHFIRTTDEDHKEAVNYAWTLLRERGYIYLSKHEGWYAVSDETFYPQSKVHLIVEPSTGRKIMASIETGKEVEWSSEENYRFRLSKFQKPLLDYYNEHRDWILPASRMENVVRDVAHGLDDLSVSRPSSRLSWGIPVPGDSSQTIYVWLDALINYVTKAGYPWRPHQSHDGGWPADCHVIGKEIVRFHCIYWPAFLMALGIPLPRKVLTHSHWTLGHEKMSKSTGNVVDPFFALSRFGVDTIRFYLAHDGNMESDADYGNENIISRYKKTLQGGLGNLASRITRGKGWNVRSSVEAMSKSLAERDQKTHSAEENEIVAVDDMASPAKTSVEHRSGLLQAHETQEQLLRRLPIRFARLMDKLDVHNATKALMTVVAETNQYVTVVQPWNLASTAKVETQAKNDLDRALFNCAETLRIVGILLQPAMPTDMSRLLDMIGVADERRTFTWAHYGSDVRYGKSRVDLGAGLLGVLFPPLRSEE